MMAADEESVDIELFARDLRKGDVRYYRIDDEDEEMDMPDDYDPENTQSYVDYNFSAYTLSNTQLQ